MLREPFIRLANEGRAVLLAGDINRFVATGQETNGAYAQWEVVVPPGGGPRPHVHSREEESIYVLNGEVVLRVGDTRTVARAGTFAGLPVGVPHAFTNESDLPARLLFTVAPAGLEGFFFEAGVEVAPGGASARPPISDDLGRLDAAAAKYGISFVSSPHEGSPNSAARTSGGRHLQTLDTIYQRRAIKHYDPTHVLTDTEIEQLMAAAVQSPTSFNIQNWRFVLVRDPEQRQRIRAFAFDQAQVTEASLLIVMTADLKAWQKNPQRYWQHAPKEVREQIDSWLGPFYEGNEQLQRDEAMRSLGLAGQTIMLAAKAMGYDSCPMIGFEADKVAEVIGLPADHVVGFLVVVGKGTKPAWPKPGQLPLSEVVVWDRFPG